MGVNVQEWTKLQKECGAQQAQLIAVSKTKPLADILRLHELGQLDFGENRVQELCDKQAQLPDTIRWHAIGHLQRNKVKHIAPFVYRIHSVDSARLLNEIQKQATLHKRSLSVLLQVHIARETSKFGLDDDELLSLIARKAGGEWPDVPFHGLMGMATFTDDRDQIREEFEHLFSLFQRIQKQRATELPTFKELSMGMSGDYKVALSCGATWIRIGSLLFGAR